MNTYNIRKFVSVLLSLCFILATFTVANAQTPSQAVQSGVFRVRVAGSNETASYTARVQEGGTVVVYLRFEMGANVPMGLGMADFVVSYNAALLYRVPGAVQILPHWEDFVPEPAPGQRPPAPTTITSGTSSFEFNIFDINMTQLITPTDHNIASITFRVRNNISFPASGYVDAVINLTAPDFDLMAIPPTIGIISPTGVVRIFGTPTDNNDIPPPPPVQPPIQPEETTTTPEDEPENITPPVEQPPVEEQPAPPTPPTIPADATPIMRFVINSMTYTHMGIAREIEAAPFIDPIYERTMVPLRAISEGLGAVVEWDAETATITIIHGASTAQMTIGQPLPFAMGVPVIVNDRTFVPVRYVSEVLGAGVRWDGEHAAVYIYQ